MAKALAADKRSNNRGKQGPLDPSMAKGKYQQSVKAAIGDANYTQMRSEGWLITFNSKTSAKHPYGSVSAGLYQAMLAA